MKKHIVYLIAAFGITCFGILDVSAKPEHKDSANRRGFPVLRTLQALQADGVRIEVRDKSLNSNLKWVEADIYDEPYPLTLNIVAGNHGRVRRIVYLITSSSLNFRSSFFTPVDEGLAFYFAKRGYLVVGITPREDNVPLDADRSVMQDWGMEKHRLDVRSVVEPIQALIDAPYDVLGHSFGAIVALDYAAEYSEETFESVLLLDVPSFGPDDNIALSPDTALPAAMLADLSLGAYAAMLEEGHYGDESIAELKTLVNIATLWPNADTGVPRPLPLPGNFTANGLLHFSLIFTAFLPGAITEYVEDLPLPQEWPMVLGNAAGWYTFAENPLNDDFGLAHIDMERLANMAAAVGSGLTPIALARDYTAAIADRPPYTIDWAGIDETVRWMNGELGMGAQTYGATAIENAGNQDVTVTVAPMYGHIDVILGATAAEDVWPYLLP